MKRVISGKRRGAGTPQRRVSMPGPLPIYCVKERILVSESQFLVLYNGTHFQTSFRGKVLHTEKVDAM